MKRPTDFTIQRVLDEKASLHEAEAVAAWFATDEGRVWLSARMDRDAVRIAEGHVPLLADIPSDELLHRIERIIDRRRRRTLLLRVAAVLIPCVLILAAWFDMNDRLGGQLFSVPMSEEVAAVYGERKEIIFQDGTKVWLNAGSKIVYPARFGLQERRIRLDGEAFFKVTPQARRPFVVEIGDVEVQVLGTSFNVRAYDYESTVDVVLVEGMVRFRHGDDCYLVEPSQKLVYDKQTGQGQLFRHAETARETMWRDNVICFRDAPLAQVISTLERWYDVRFEVGNREAYEYSFSLQTSDIPLPELLREMERISSLSFETDKGVVRVNLKRRR